MLRTVQVELNQVDPVPHGLRADPEVNSSLGQATVNLGQLFQHYYFDSYAASAPAPDPSRFEYLQHVSSNPDFRFHAHVAEASTIKKRDISASLGQAFCRWMLHDHFGARYFAHMADVLDKPSHAAFEGLRVSRVVKGDVPDYLCARDVTKPFIAEAKGRFSAVGFATQEFQRWREQFKRILVLDGRKRRLKLKGFVVCTRFATDAQAPTRRTTVYVEDPETDGEAPGEEYRTALGRVTAAVHYSRVFRKLGLAALAAALESGFSLAPELRFIVPTWECMVPPLVGVRFAGGYFQTQSGNVPQWNRDLWQMPMTLDRGHAAFVGLKVPVAEGVSAAARGEWNRLDDLPFLFPQGLGASEVSWLLDGTVVAPLEYFRPTGDGVVL